MELKFEVGDPQALKIVAVHKFTNNYNLNIIKSTSTKGISLPLVTVSDSVELSSSNAAVLLLSSSRAAGDSNSLEFGAPNYDVYSWLEWEATLLQPAIWNAIKKSDTSCVDHVLHTLEQHLTTTDGCILNNGISFVDIALWCTLYPVAELSSLNHYPAVFSWFRKISDLPSVKDSIVCVVGDGVDAVKVSQQYLQSKAVPTFTKVLPAQEKIKPQKVQKNVSKNVVANVKQTESRKHKDEDEKTPELSADEVKSAAAEFKEGIKTAPKPATIPKPILPCKNERNILITSALPYVNNVPHLGNIIGSTLSADVFARFCRLRGYRTLYICGTDEYGTATETKALQEGVTPEQICNKYHKIHAEVYQWFNISTDYFGRTTTEEQTKISQDIFWKLYKNGFISEDSMEQLLCEQCNKFLADRFCEGVCPLCGYDDARGDQCDECGKLLNATELKQPRCKICKSSPVIKTSKHLFLDLPKLEDDLKTWLDKDSSCWTPNSRGIAYSWLRDGLKPRCITRDLLWGTPVPLDGYKQKVFYVWYDAPIGYISMTAKYTDQWEKWWKNTEDVKLYNFLGKDNVPFHAIIFPACQLGTKDPYTTVNHMSATEYLNYEDSKFSKSRGVGVFGTDCKETGIPSDIWRFYLLCSRPESQDSAFSWTDFQLRNNNELLNNFGNFVNRSLSFLDKYFDGVVPNFEFNDDSEEVIAQVRLELRRYIELLEKVQIREALKNILNISRIGNQYIQSNKPWELVKPDSSDSQRLLAGSVIGLSCNISCLLSVMLSPYMPDMSANIQEQLKAPAECNILHGLFVCYLKPGHKIGQPKPLVQKIDSKRIDELRKKFAGNQTQPSKKQLAASGDSSEIDALSKAVDQQGNAVRQLKSRSADKAEIAEAVNKLLQLKAQLATAQGIDPATVTGKQKKGKKK